VSKSQNNLTKGELKYFFTSLGTGIYTKIYLVPSRLSLCKIHNIGAQIDKLF